MDVDVQMDANLNSPCKHPSLGPRARRSIARYSMHEKPDFDQCASGSAVVWNKGRPFGAALAEASSSTALAASVFWTIYMRIKRGRL